VKTRNVQNIISFGDDDYGTRGANAVYSSTNNLNWLWDSETQQSYVAGTTVGFYSSVLYGVTHVSSPNTTVIAVLRDSNVRF